MKITLEINENQKDRLINSFGHDWPARVTEEYQEEITNPETKEVTTETRTREIDNPQTKGEFAKERLIEYIKNYVANYERTHQSVEDLEIT